jgi:hypothetical protein
MKLSEGKVKVMKKILCVSVICVASAILSCGSSPSSGSDGFVIDHTKTSTSGFSTEDISKAEAVRIYFEHASVGANICDGLDAMSGELDRSNIVDNARGNPGWQAKADLFSNDIDGTPYNANDFDALMFKFCYIDNGIGAGNVQAGFDYVRNIMEDLESLYPNKTFVWWTMPLHRGDPPNDDGFNNERHAYNTLVRDYCTAHNKVLFDIADIECHDPSGNRIQEGGYDSLYSGYASDNEGHLNATGSDRVARVLEYGACSGKHVMVLGSLRNIGKS